MIIQPINIYKTSLKTIFLYFITVLDNIPIKAHDHITDSINIPTFLGSENIQTGVYVAAMNMYIPI